MFIKNPVNKILLFDLDQVCVGFHIGITEKWRERWPDKDWIDPKDMKKMYASENYPPHLQKILRSMIYERGFFRDLPPIPGAIEAMEYIARCVPKTFICTKPLAGSRYCLQEKDDWVRKYLGSYLANRMIIAPDKTLIHGTYLIDDMPYITGEYTPTWEHLLFDAPYNRDVTDKKRIDWSNYRELLEI